MQTEVHVEDNFNKTALNYDKSTYKNMVIEYIKKKMFNGSYIEGDKINESQLSKMFNISKGPVHQAILQLEVEGLLHCEKNIGCRVKILNGKEMWDYFLLRAELEEMALNFYNDTSYESLIEKLNRIVQEMESAAKGKNLYKLIKLDTKFHETIVGYSKKNRLINCWKILNNSVDSIYYAILHTGTCSFYELPIFNRYLISYIGSDSFEKLSTVVRTHYIETGLKLLELC